MQRIKTMLMQLKAEFDFRREVRRKLDALTNHGLIARLVSHREVPVKSSSRAYRVRVRIK